MSSVPPFFTKAEALSSRELLLGMHSRLNDVEQGKFTPGQMGQIRKAAHEALDSRLKEITKVTNDAKLILAALCNKSEEVRQLLNEAIARGAKV